MKRRNKPQAAILLGKYMHELRVWAQGEIEAAALHKARFLTGGSESSRCEERKIQSRHARCCERTVAISSSYTMYAGVV